jgi:hypothetical protein
MSTKLSDGRTLANASEDEIMAYLQSEFEECKVSWKHYVREFIRKRWGRVDNIEAISFERIWANALMAAVANVSGGNPVDVDMDSDIPESIEPRDDN